MALTPREAAFLEALLGEARGNQTKAAETADYAAGPGLSVQATRLMKRAHVQAAIAERRAALMAVVPDPVPVAEDAASEAEKVARWRAQLATDP
jgi:phage terminase small subunit